MTNGMVGFSYIERDARGPRTVRTAIAPACRVATALGFGKVWRTVGEQHLLGPFRALLAVAARSLCVNANNSLSNAEGWRKDDGRMTEE